MKKWWAKTLLGLAAILLVLAVLILISHAHSKNALEQYKDQLRAAGEKLTVDELQPPRAAPENNGAKLFFQAIPYLSYEGLISTNPPPAMRMVALGRAMIGWRQPEIVSLYETPPVTNTWNDIEQELKQRAPGLDMLRQAATRPELDFGLDYHYSSMSGLNYLMKIKEAAFLLSSATVCDLNRGETDSSVTNLHTFLTFVDEWKNEPVVISQLVRMAMAAIAGSAQWEVLQATNLTDSELAVLQHDWESMEFVKPMENSLKMDRVWVVAAIQNLRTSNSPSKWIVTGVFPSSSATSSGTLLDLVKDVGRTASRKTSDTIWRISWSYSDELRDLQGYQVMIDSVRQIETNGSFKDALAERDRKIDALGLNGESDNWLRNCLNDDLLDLFGSAPETVRKTIDRTLAIEATRKIVNTAIALKRYQLRRGTWPADLNALVPEFLSELPRDPADGLPLRYRPNADGTFTLYSIGADNKDDGGDPAPRGSSTSIQWQRGRDWVWPQPATAEAIQNYYNHLPK